MAAWYKEWFGHEYLELYSYRDAGEAQQNVDFVRRVMEEDGEARNGVRVLDLACGAGRHTAALRDGGLDALGVDLSLTLLARAAGLPRLAGDMRCLPLADESFDWVLNFFTSFGYFERERENFRVLEEIARVLAPGGWFLMDLFNSERVIAGLEPREERQVAGRRVGIERWYDEASKRVNKRISIEVEDGRAQTFLESVRAYRPEEVVIGMAWAGLEVTARYGNFDGEQFSGDSPRLILVGHKAGA